MEGVQIEVIAKPRFKTVGEIREAARNRHTPQDDANRLLKLKTDCNVAIAKLDRALAGGTRRQPTRLERRSADMEYSNSNHWGQVLNVR